MKKALAILLSIGIITSLAACGGENEAVSSQNTASAPIIQEAPADKEPIAEPQPDFEETESFEEIVKQLR